MMRIHLLTAAAHAGLAPDDRGLFRALRGLGVDAVPVVWEDPLVEWSDAPVTVIRSTWDYTFRRAPFLEQLERISKASTLLNRLDVVAWNTHKRYLLELDARGVATVPTTLVPRATSFDLAAHVEERGWAEVVVKPAVGAAGRWTERFSRTALKSGQTHLDRVLLHEDALVQPMMPSIEREGEISVIALQGSVTHAVQKKGAPGDFRVHEDHGGEVSAVHVDDEVLDLVRRTLAAVPGPTFYARVDVVRGLDGAPCLMELELVEPELFFAWSETGTRQMAEALVALASAEPSAR